MSRLGSPCVMKFGYFTALSDVEYDSDIIIEHEDPTYPGHEGLRRGAKFLRQ